MMLGKLAIKWGQAVGSRSGAENKNNFPFIRYLQSHTSPQEDFLPLPGAISLEPGLHELIEPDQALPAPPPWVTGHISLTDARFLHNFVRLFPVAPIVEIGVASGYSSAVLLNACSHFLPPQDAPYVQLFSMDISSTCYFAPERPTGSAVQEMVPGLDRSWCLATEKTAVDARQCPEPFALAFIDGNHQHPWPVFDLLALLPVLKPGAWILLHDIFLPLQEGNCTSNGPSLLFHFWPGERMLQSPNHETRNVGAVRLPADLDQLHHSLAILLQMQWECEGPPPALQERILFSKS